MEFQRYGMNIHFYRTLLFTYIHIQYKGGIFIHIAEFYKMFIFCINVCILLYTSLIKIKFIL